MVVGQHTTVDLESRQTSCILGAHAVIDALVREVVASGHGRFEIDDPRVRLHAQIPTVGLKCVKDAPGKTGWTEELHGFLLPDEQTKQMVESNEMIDMRVRNEDLVDASYLPRRQ
jgi:hypothetical protein